MTSTPSLLMCRLALSSGGDCAVPFGSNDGALLMIFPSRRSYFNNKGYDAGHAGRVPQGLAGHRRLGGPLL